MATPPRSRTTGRFRRVRPSTRGFSRSGRLTGPVPTDAPEVSGVRTGPTITLGAVEAPAKTTKTSSTSTTTSPS